MVAHSINSLINPFLGHSGDVQLVIIQSNRGKKYLWTENLYTVLIISKPIYTIIGLRFLNTYNQNNCITLYTYQM